MEYYYTEPENIDKESKLLLIKGYEYKHLVKVLRKKKDDIISITDGLRNIYVTKIVNIQKDSIQCEITETKYNLNEPKINLRLFLSPLRKSDRFEFLVEKAVELGVYEIQPVISKHSILQTSFSKAKMERLHKIMISAMGQSQRCYLPVLHNTMSLKEMIISAEVYKNKYVYYEYAENKKGIITKLDNEENICIFTGPEGGFDKSEIQQLIENNWQVRSLGERKLRAETAAIISVFENLKNL
ncbi:MAG: RsmE family RNA methyltransferase [Ignavibacteria bacterium]